MFVTGDRISGQTDLSTIEGATPNCARAIPSSAPTGWCYDLKTWPRRTGNVRISRAGKGDSYEGSPPGFDRLDAF